MVGDPGTEGNTGAAGERGPTGAAGAEGPKVGITKLERLTPVAYMCVFV